MKDLDKARATADECRELLDAMIQHYENAIHQLEDERWELETGGEWYEWYCGALL